MPQKLVSRLRESPLAAACAPSLLEISALIDASRDGGQGLIKNLLALKRPAETLELEALAALERDYMAFRLHDAPASAPGSVFDPAHVKPVDRQRVKKLGASLSMAYNEFAMGCLDDHAEVANACLERALTAAPHGSNAVVITLSNLGICCQRLSKPAVALRYLTRAVSLDRKLSAEFRARLRLNLSAVLTDLGSHNDALQHVREPPLPLKNVPAARD